MPYTNKTGMYVCKVTLSLYF